MLKNRNFAQKLKLCSKSKFYSKIWIVLKNRNSVKKLEPVRKESKHRDASEFSPNIEHLDQMFWARWSGRYSNFTFSRFCQNSKICSKMEIRSKNVNLNFNKRVEKWKFVEIWRNQKFIFAPNILSNTEQLVKTRKLV